MAEEPLPTHLLTNHNRMESLSSPFGCALFDFWQKWRYFPTSKPYLVLSPQPTKGLNVHEGGQVALTLPELGDKFGKCVK